MASSLKKPPVDESMMRQRAEPEFEPRVELSVWPTREGQWAMGSLILCERIADGTSAPSDAIVSWKDGHGVDYCLRPQTTRLPVPEYDPANASVIPFHWSIAFFKIGHDILVKAQYAPVGWPKTEGETMKFVREKDPSVPVPEPIHFWHDKELDRYFTITRRVPGVVLDNVWFQLSEEDKRQVINELAAHTKAVTAITAPRYQYVDGSPTGDPTFLDNEPALRIYDPRPNGFPGPFTAEELREYMRELSEGVEPPEFGPDFHLFHNDMSPYNVVLSGTDEPKEEGKSHVHVAAITDWQEAAFFPKFWIFLRLTIPGGYFLYLTQEQMETDMNSCGEYIKRLIAALIDLGLPDGRDYLPWYNENRDGNSKVITRQIKAARDAGVARW